MITRPESISRLTVSNGTYVALHVMITFFLEWDDDPNKEIDNGLWDQDIVPGCPSAWKVELSFITASPILPNPDLWERMRRNSLAAAWCDARNLRDFESTLFCV
jgi:hypothetical protein